MLLSFFQEFMAGLFFLAFVLLSMYSWYVVFTVDERELKGFNSRFFKFSEVLFWAEVALGIVIASISVGNWLGGVL